MLLLFDHKGLNNHGSNHQTKSNPKLFLHMLGESKDKKSIEGEKVSIDP
jgi:hypothetical protein